MWHAYSTNYALPNDTKVDDFVTLTLMLKITFFGLVATVGTHLVTFRENTEINYDTAYVKI